MSTNTSTRTNKSVKRVSRSESDFSTLDVHSHICVLASCTFDWDARHANYFPEGGNA